MVLLGGAEHLHFTACPFALMLMCIASLGAQLTVVPRPC